MLVSRLLVRYNNLELPDEIGGFRNHSMDDRTNSTQLEAGGEIAIVDERTIRDKIYIIRGVKVMLDFELAEIYELSAF